MFNGADKYGPKEFDRILESNGGYSNAFTSEDMTAYYEDFASNILELCIDLDSDRMKSLALDPKYRRLGAGRRQGGAAPAASTTRSTARCTRSSARSPTRRTRTAGRVIGWMSDLEKITRDDAVKLLEDLLRAEQRDPHHRRRFRHEEGARARARILRRHPVADAARAGAHASSPSSRASGAPSCTRPPRCPRFSSAITSPT